MLAKQHPIVRNYVDLKRCIGRTEFFLDTFPEDQTNEADRYMQMLEHLKQAMELVPREYR